MGSRAPSAAVRPVRFLSRCTRRPAAEDDARSGGRRAGAPSSTAPPTFSRSYVNALRTCGQSWSYRLPRSHQRRLEPSSPTTSRTWPCRPATPDDATSRRSTSSAATLPTAPNAADTIAVSPALGTSRTVRTPGGVPRSADGGRQPLRARRASPKSFAPSAAFAMPWLCQPSCITPCHRLDGPIATHSGAGHAGTAAPAIAPHQCVGLLKQLAGGRHQSPSASAMSRSQSRCDQSCCRIS